MAAKKYPIGTKIRFIHPRFDTGLTGTIVGLTTNRGPDVYLPTAEKHVKYDNHPTLDDGTKFTWHCSWNEIEPLVLLNQQLLFSFMHDG